MMPRHLCTLLLLFLCWGRAAAEGVTLPEATRIVLDNGTVLLLNEKHDVPMIGVTAMLRGGAVTDPADKQGLANLFAGLLERGAGKRDGAAFAEAIDAVGGSLSAGAELEHIEISGDFLARDADLMVELLADMLQRPALSREELDTLRERSINFILAAKDSDPGPLLPVYGAAFLFGEHAYGNSMFGSEHSLRNIGYRDITDYYAEQVGADRLVVAVSGDFDAAAMAEKLVTAFGEWRAAAAALPVVTAPEKQAGNRLLLIDKPGATQTYFWIGNVGVARNYAARADLDLAHTVFGGRFTSMLNTALRIESGLTYGARSLLVRPSHAGSVAVYSYTRTDATNEAIDMALSVLRQLRESGIDDAMIASARNYVMGQFPTNFETATQLANVFAAIETHELDATRYIDAYGDDIARVDGESIQAVIDAVYPRDDALVFVLLGDAERIRETINQYGTVTEISITEPRFSPAIAVSLSD